MSTDSPPSAMTTVLLGGEELDVPNSLLEDHEVFSSVLSMDTWSNVLEEGDRNRLRELLPKQDGGSQSEEDILQSLFSGDNLRFGNPVDQLWKKLNNGSLTPETTVSRDCLKQLKFHQYELSQQTRYLHLFQEILLSRQHLLQNALFSGGLENLTPSDDCQILSDREESVGRRTRNTFRRLLSEVREECGQENDYLSSDEDSSTNRNRDASQQPISEEEYRKMLRKHRKQRKIYRKTNLDAVVGGLTEKQAVASNIGPLLSQSHAKEEDHVISKRTREDQEMGVSYRGVGGARRRKDRVADLRTSASQSQTVYEVYGRLENSGSGVDAPIDPISLESPLPVGRFMSFFSLLKHVFENVLGGKGELNKLTKNVRHILRSSEVSNCVWVRSREDWLHLTLSAICYLAAEVGAVSSFAPLSHFIPIVEFRDRIDHWKWIGHGRDSDVELLILCNHWLEDLNKSLSIVDYSEYEPPPPHVWTTFTFRSSTLKEITKFRQLERERYSTPQKSFVYSVHGFEAPVGPVKGSRSTKKEASSKARGHALLIPQRPTCVTILSLVRDATSRLPNGEGTRIDLCVLVQDSQYLADNVSDTQLNNAVSGALDRLHYEKDPCVRYDGSRKVWIYLHRGRSEEDFERIFWACEVAANQRKRLMSRPRIKPRVLMRRDGREVVLEPGGSSTTADDQTAKHTKKASKNPPSATNPSSKMGSPHSTPSVVVASVIPGANSTDLKQSSELTISKISSTAGQEAKSAPSGKPTRKRKPTQKIVEQQREVKSRKHHHKDTPLKAPPSTTLQASDWETSDEETILPFLDSSLASTEDKLNPDSAGSSWQSSDSDREDPDPSRGDAPDFRVNPLTPNVANRLLSSSSTPSFMNEPPDNNTSNFLPQTPTGGSSNFLPETPTVTTPTFMADISMEDESDVLSQQLMEGSGGEHGKWLTSSGSASSDSD